MAKHHEWEDSRSGIRKHYKKILYPTMGVALVGTTTAAVALPIMIKKIATERTMDILSKILPIGGPENSLKDNEWVQKKDGKVNYLAIGDSVTAGYNGYMSRNDVVKDDVLANPYHAFSTNTGAEESKPDASNVVALTNELKQIETDLKTATGTAKTELEQRKAFIELYMEDHAQHTTSDYLSYADFVAGSLAKNNKLADYRNFALTGATVPNLRQTIMRNTTALAAVENADLISLSIGANDLLAAVEVLRLGWNAIRGQVETDRVSQFNAARDAIDAITKVNSETKTDDFTTGEHGWRTATASGYASEWDTKDLIKKSFNKLVNMLNAGTLGGLFDVQQKLLDAIFDLIQLDVATAVNELHQAAPDAKIIVMGYAFPFHLLPKSLTEAPIFQYNEKAFSSDRSPRLVDGKQVSLKDVFMHTVDTIKETVERANYAKFFDINDLKEFQEGSDQVKYTLTGSPKTATEEAVADQVVTRPEWDRVMPNPLDIHPSTYGHQVIAGHLFEWISQDLGIKVPEYKSIQKLDATQDATLISSLEAIYTYAGVDSHFDIRDEKVAYDSASLISMLSALDNPVVLKILGTVIPEFIDGDALANNATQIQKDFANLNLDGKTMNEKIDAIYKLVKPVLNVNQKFGNVAGFTVGKFVDQLIATLKTVNWDKVDFGLVDADNKMDTKQIVVDLLDPEKGDGIVVFELLSLFGIYMGDTGEAIASTSHAHTPVADSDTFIKSIISNIKDDTRETFKERVALMNAGKPIDIDGDSTLYMLLQYIQMNLNAFNATKTFQLVNLVAKGTNGERTPWVVVDKTTGDPTSSNFSKVLDEIKDLGISLGLDITNFFTGVTDKEDFGTSLFMGDAASSKVWIYKLFGNAGFDVSTKSFWTANFSDPQSLRSQARAAKVDLTASFDSIWEKVLEFSSNHSAY